MQGSPWEGGNVLHILQSAGLDARTEFASGTWEVAFGFSTESHLSWTGRVAFSADGSQAQFQISEGTSGVG